MIPWEFNLSLLQVSLTRRSHSMLMEFRPEVCLVKVVGFSPCDSVAVAYPHSRSFC